MRLRNRTARPIIVVLCLAIISSGCWVNQKEAAKFAEAGTTYTAAMDQLLVRAGDLTIDANSEFLVARDTQSPLTTAQYMALRDADVEKLKVINRLRAHTKLLAKYFELLYELGTSKAPGEVSTAIEGTVKNINDLGNTIRGSSLLSAAATNVITGVTKIAVTAKIRHDLDEELKARNQVIRRELTTQEELLKALAADIQQNLQIASMTREQRLVIDPLIAAAPIPAGQIDSWKAGRKMAITARMTVDDLENASKAIAKLREAYERLLYGKLDISRINDALEDFEQILSTSESLKKFVEGTK